jgi:hypothetical protein
LRIYCHISEHGQSAPRFQPRFRGLCEKMQLGHQWSYQMEVVEITKVKGLPRSFRNPSQVQFDAHNGNRNWVTAVTCGPAKSRASQGLWSGQCFARARYCRSPQPEARNRSYFPPRSSLAIVASCMLDVPS